MCRSLFDFRGPVSLLAQALPVLMQMGSFLGPFGQCRLGRKKKKVKKKKKNPIMDKQSDCEL